jgi:hypothetical protein
VQSLAEGAERVFFEKKAERKGVTIECKFIVCDRVYRLGCVAGDAFGNAVYDSLHTSGALPEGAGDESSGIDQTVKLCGDIIGVRNIYLIRRIKYIYRYVL